MEWIEVIRLLIVIPITAATFRYAARIVEKRNAKEAFKQYQREKANHYIKEIL